MKKSFSIKNSSGRNKSENLLANETLYPHLKLTNEEFPRLLVTRKIESDGAEYFGAFLPATGVRFWLEFINRMFRLRICEIPIDGSFPSPCTQFYAKRCLAPCVESLCDRKNYLEMVELVRLFLQNERQKFNDVVLKKIETASEHLEFETAAYWHDILQKTNEVFSKKDWNLWLDDAVDTLETEKKDSQIFVYLVTQRSRKTLGKKVFVFDKELEAAEILGRVIEEFYRFHAPKEIRVPFDFPRRKEIIRFLSQRENHSIKFTIFGQSNERKTSIQALKRAKFDFDFKQIKPQVEPNEVSAELKQIFQLSSKPRKVEAFDAAHISGSDFTAAKAVWENGKLVIQENEFWLSDERSELDSLRHAIGERFQLNRFTHPDLLLIDGGKSQLQAAVKAVGFLGERKFTIICAVKPPGRHSEISHFITENGKTINFSSDSEAMRVLLRLRNEAHSLTNKVHRQRRENSHFYELAQILPSINERERRELLQKFGSLKNLLSAEEGEISEVLDSEKTNFAVRDLKSYPNLADIKVMPLIVPLRFDDPNGDAADLQPLNYTKI